MYWTRACREAARPLLEPIGAAPDIPDVHHTHASVRGEHAVTASAPAAMTSHRRAAIATLFHRGVAIPDIARHTGTTRRYVQDVLAEQICFGLIERS